MKKISILRGLSAIAFLTVSALTSANADLIDRIKPVGDLCMEGEPCAAAVVEVISGPRSGEELYNTKCMSCHASGVAGAPKFGDLVAWQVRVDARGIDGIFNNAWNGINAMPAKGTCGDCTEDEIKDAIAFMVGS